MEQIPFDVDETLANQPDEFPADRRARLEVAVRQVVAVHKSNVAQYTPLTLPASGLDRDLDAGRNAIWKLDDELLELGERGWR